MDRHEFTGRLGELHERLNGVFEQFQNESELPESAYQQAIFDLQVMFEELQVASEELEQRDQSLIEAQAIIDAERQRYMNLFNYAPDGYVVTDERVLILEANQTAAAMFNVPLAGLDRKPITVYIDANDHPRIFKQLLIKPKVAGSYERVDIGEVLMQPRHQEPFWARVILAIGEFDSVHHPGKIHVLWKIHDINQLKQAQEELKEARDELELRVQERTEELVEANETLRQALSELELRNKELQEFAFAASHDLQEPLRKISKFGELVMAHAEEEMDSESADYVRRMVSAARRMEAMIAGLLEYARVSTHQQPCTPVDLSAVAQEVASDLDVARMRVAGEIKLDPLPTIEADPVQMRQLLQNLISNGLKFHREAVPPKVEVSAQMSGNGAAQATTNRQEEATWVELRVKDNGIGFDAQYLERMLQPFERLNRPGDYEGTGMGLAICRKIVERHGGKIAVTSSEGRGTTFLVTLPVRQEAR